MTRILAALFALILAIAPAAGAQKIKHPSLLFTPARVEAAAKAVRTDTVMQKAWDEIRGVADSQLEGRYDIMKLEHLALAYMMTGDERYAARIRQILLETAQVKSWSNAEMMARKPAWRSELQMAHRSYQVAVAYDAVYDFLTPSERRQIADGMYRLAVEPLLGDWLIEPSRIHSLNSMGHNWWSSCTGMGGLLALAISNENEQARQAAATLAEAMPEWFFFAGDQLQHKPRTFDRDGGMYESINYASFGTSEALIFMLAWLNSHPGAKFEDIPQIQQIVPFFCHVAYPRTGQLHSINFGDSHKNVTGERSMIIASALGVENPATRWYVSQVTPGQHKEGLMHNTPLGFLYAPSLAGAPAEPGLPLSHLWKDFGWATMRDSWQKDATMLAAKSGMTWNHAHADANSFILFHKGVDILKDAGNCWYPNPAYRNYFFQSDAHNVVKFNGHGQPAHQQYHGSMLPGSMSGLVDGGSIKYVLADGTGPMSQWLNRNFRSFLWVDSVIFVIDDLASHEAGSYEWLWHPGGKTRKNGFDLEITNGDAAVALRPLFPRPLAYSNFVHDYPDDLYWEVITAPTENLKGEEEYYSFKLPGITDKVKGLTAIILKDSPDDRNLPVIERREGKDWIGVRVTHNGKVTDLYINQLADGPLMHLNSWIEADGWNTDAYVLAVSYPEGGNPAEPSEFFVGYGSALRRGADVYFSSLSKLNLAATSEGRKLNIAAGGQPRMNFKVKGSPAALSVNGLTVPVVRDGSLVKVRVNEQD